MVTWTIVAIVGVVTVVLAAELLVAMFTEEKDNGEDL